MSNKPDETLLEQLTEGRTDLVFDLLQSAIPADFRDAHGAAPPPSSANCSTAISAFAQQIKASKPISSANRR